MWPEVRRVVLRQGLVGLEETRIGQHLVLLLLVLLLLLEVLLREGLRLYSRQVLRGGELRVADTKGGGVAKELLRLIEAEARDAIVEGRMG